MIRRVTSRKLFNDDVKNAEETKAVCDNKFILLKILIGSLAQGGKNVCDYTKTVDVI